MPAVINCVITGGLCGAAVYVVAAGSSPITLGAFSGASVMSLLLTVLTIKNQR